MFQYRGDLYLPDGDLWIDPHEPKRFAFISHAHGDHIERHEQSITSYATARILEHRLGPQNLIRLEWGEEHELAPGVVVRLHPAGHILGSAQLEVVQRGRRLVYSGDFRLKPSVTAEPAPVVPCDILVMECTYGRPHYRFPPREEVIPRLVEEIRGLLEEGRTPVMLAYTLGRSQELLKLLESYEFDIALAPPIHSMVRVYESLGVTFGKYRQARPGQTDGAVVFVPPHASKSRIVKRAKDPVTIAATGWAVDGEKGVPYPTDRSFPLSDHADFDELKEYVERSGAREVYTVHGFDEFHKHLRDSGVRAHPAEVRVAVR